MTEAILKDAIESYMARMPEPKLELIEGQLIVGNGLVGSRHLLWEILSGYGAEAALALAPRALWVQALQHAFHFLSPPSFVDFRGTASPLLATLPAPLRSITGPS